MYKFHKLWTESCKLTENITRNELEDWIKTFSNNKGAELDNIPIEVWKTGALTVHLLDICNKSFNGDKYTCEKCFISKERQSKQG